MQACYFPIVRKDKIMEKIINLLPVLAVAIAMNIGAGLYYNIGTKNLTFNFKKLISGIIKATIVAGMFVGTAYCFEATDLSSIGITPIFIMMSAITLYVGKALKSLCMILGIETKSNKKE